MDMIKQLESIEDSGESEDEADIINKKRRFMTMAKMQVVCLSYVLSKQGDNTDAHHHKKKHKKKRLTRPFRKRLNFDDFLSAEVNTNKNDFQKSIRMSTECFHKLHNILYQQLHGNHTMGALRGGLVDSRLRLYITLRYLGGGQIHDIRHHIGVESTTAYNIILQFCKAILDNNSLKIKFQQQSLSAPTVLNNLNPLALVMPSLIVLL